MNPELLRENTNQRLFHQLKKKSLIKTLKDLLLVVARADNFDLRS